MNLKELDKLDKTYFLTTASISTLGSLSVSAEEILSYGKSKVSAPEIILENQRDLMKIISVLVSTGINRNDDVFLPEEILPVRNTGAHKPLNVEHDPKQIVGHMLRTYAALKDGSIVPPNSFPDTNEFDIIAESVLYKFLFPDLAEEVKHKAKANQLFVSIEAWFTAYDFLVGTKIVKRNKETSQLLDGKLKSNGGDGTFENQRVGRVLRNIIIGGIGLVKTPANSESIIKSVSNLQSEFVPYDIKDNTISQSIIGDIFQLSTNNLKLSEEKMNKEVLEEIAQVIAAQRAAAIIPVEIKTDKTETKTNTSEISPEVKLLLERVSALEKGNRELKNKLDITEIKAEALERAEILNNMGFSDEFIAKQFTKSLFMNRLDFNDHVNFLKLALSELTKEVKKVETKTEIKVKTKEKATEGGDTAKAAGKTELKTEVKTEQLKADTKVEIKTETKEVDVKTEVKPEVKTEVKTEIKNEKTADDAETDNSTENDTETEDEDVISLEDLDLVDKEVKVETDTKKSAPSLTEQMANVVQMFLKERNDKWGKLALK